jgi:predicted RNase H-like nuclease
MLFVGIDLAWSERNASGVAVIEGDKRSGHLLSVQTILQDSEMTDYIEKETAGRKCLIAIDAPLIVPNDSGRRIAERMVGKLFRKYDAGAHPANRKRLSQWSGKIRGEEMANSLEAIGFEHSPFIKRFEESRKFFEVYPHPSMVVLFGLSRILRYKAKPKRDYESRWREFERYHSCLKSLESSRPRLVLPEGFFRRVKDLRGSALKDYEDTLDAVFCAYLAYYLWHHPEKCAVLGDMTGGYIVTPIFDSMRKQLASLQTKLQDFK